jgi:phospholipid transport system substrate-binding protein
MSILLLSRNIFRRLIMCGKAAGGSRLRTASRSIAPFLLLIVLMPVSVSYAASEIPDPAAVIQNFNSALLEAMKKADQLGYSGRYKLLDPVIRNSFALSFMAVQSVGRYGKTLKPGDRELLIRSYTDWTVATYAGRFDGYSGEKFEVVPGSAPLQGTATVTSKLIKQNGEEVVFRYQLRRIEGVWRVVDIKISGVSQLALTRAQFTGVIKGGGFNGLISMLNEKTKKFEKAGEKK